MIEELERAAREENWGYVDETLQGHTWDKDLAERASNNWIKDSDENVRDLGATTLEKTRIQLSDLPGAEDDLRDLMSNYPPGYDGFRAACALVAHKSRYTDQALAVIEKATLDEDDSVREIAKGYLAAQTFK